MKETDKSDKKGNSFEIAGILIIFTMLSLAILMFFNDYGMMSVVIKTESHNVNVIIDNPYVEIIVGGILSVGVVIGVFLYAYGKYILPNRKKKKNS